MPAEAERHESTSVLLKLTSGAICGASVVVLDKMAGAYSAGLTAPGHGWTSLAAGAAAGALLNVIKSRVMPPLTKTASLVGFTLGATLNSEDSEMTGRAMADVSHGVMAVLCMSATHMAAGALEKAMAPSAFAGDGAQTGKAHLLTALSFDGFCLATMQPKKLITPACSGLILMHDGLGAVKNGITHMAKLAKDKCRETLGYTPLPQSDSDDEPEPHRQGFQVIGRPVSGVALGIPVGIPANADNTDINTRSHPRSR